MSKSEASRSQYYVQGFFACCWLVFIGFNLLTSSGRSTGYLAIGVVLAILTAAFAVYAFIKGGRLPREA